MSINSGYEFDISSSPVPAAFWLTGIQNSIEQFEEEYHHMSSNGQFETIEEKTMYLSGLQRMIVSMKKMQNEVATHFIGKSQVM